MSVVCLLAFLLEGADDLLPEKAASVVLELLYNVDKTELASTPEQQRDAFRLFLHLI